MESLVDLEPRELALAAQLMKQGREIGGLEMVKNLAAKAGKPIVDIPQAWPCCFVVQGDLPRLIDHVTAIPTAFVAKNSHQRRLAAGLKRVPDGTELNGQKRIAIDDEELLVGCALLASQPQ